MFKVAQYNYCQNQGIHQVYVLRSLAELNEFLEYASGQVDKLSRRLTRSSVPPRKWDHFATDTIEGGCLAAAMIECRINGGIPMLAMGRHLQALAEAWYDRIVAEGVNVVVNMKGGYFTATDEELEENIVSETDFDIESLKVIHINPGSKCINLENDPDLEQWVIDELSARDPSFSYILNLGDYTESQLEQHFTEFVKHGGNTIFQYTTGLNVPQMYEYSRAGIMAGIKHFEFNFNVEISDEVKDFLDWMETQPVTLKYKQV